ncbi:MAG: FGGY family carbohydrate kinase [Anaerolineales bacterium]
MNTLPPPPYLLGIDQGTSGSRALLLSLDGQVVSYGYQPLARLHPHPDWTEQDPDAVSAGVAAAIHEAIERANCRPDDILAAGIACQRNTDFVWDARTHRPLANAITWQDLRTLTLLEDVSRWNTPEEYRRRLGYLPGPYSSAPHLAWRMQHDPVVRAAAESGNLRIGLSAAWLLAALGKPAEHAMDTSLVQAMGVYDFRSADYWQEWLNFLGVPRDPLPAARPTLFEYGHLFVRDARIPVWANIGDQQSALFGYDCRAPGDAECTHGTASFVDVFMGTRAPQQANLNVYNAWQLGANQPQTYCLEADTTVTGAALRWMRESARFLDAETEVGPLAFTVPDSGGVTFIPAFTGLNVPYHDRAARGTLLGMTLGTTRAHIARAFLESIGFQLRAILETIHQDTGVRVERLHVGGGISASDEACQIQADLLGIPVIRPEFAQTTARAAALLAGLGVGAYASSADLPPLPGGRDTFEPLLSPADRDEAYNRWNHAIRIAHG